MVFLGTILDACSLVEADYGAFIALHHFDEEFGIRDLLLKPGYRLPACIRVHSAACHPPEEQHEGQDQGSWIRNVALR
jgi:hypothetical protein